MGINYAETVKHQSFLFSYFNCISLNSLAYLICNYSTDEIRVAPYETFVKYNLFITNVRLIFAINPKIIFRNSINPIIDVIKSVIVNHGLNQLYSFFFLNFIV